jgi:hypothetical protein
MPVSPIVKGYRLVATVSAVVLVLTIGNAMLFNFAVGPDWLVTFGVRAVLYGALCYLVNRGYKLARYLLGTLSALTGGVALAFAAQDLVSGAFGGLVLLAIGGLYLACAGVLFFSRSVQAYMDFRRNPR